MTNPQALLFDMDGVLVDSAEIHAEAFRHVLSQAGVSDFQYGRYAGMRTAEVVRDVFERRAIPCDPDEIARLAREKSAWAQQILETRNPLFPGSIEVLERLNGRYALALVSSGSEASVRRFLEQNGVSDLFQACVSGADVPHAKPAPDGYLAAAHRLGIHPSDCLVIEDSDSGEESARTAGCAIWRVGPDAPLSQLPNYLGLSRERVAAKPAHATPHAPEHWTAIIPAAGRGSRLGSNRAKILFEVAGRSILDWLLDLLLPRCESVVVVAAPWSRQEIAEAAGARSSRVRVVVQPEPTGMADAVECGLREVTTRHVLIIWGDQPAVQPESIESAMELHQTTCALATVPTVFRRKPYIHFSRDADGRIACILQAREGDRMPEEGETDTGVFLFRTLSLRRGLKTMRVNGFGIGRQTGERNFLPIFCLLDTLPGNVLSARVIGTDETVGVNTPEDAEFLSS